MLSPQGTTLAWYKPEIPGAAYDFVIRQAATFLKDRCPIDTVTGLPYYLLVSSFRGPHATKTGTFEGIEWYHNPACVYSGAVESFALGYMPYSGDTSYLGLVRRMLDYQLKYGTTRTDFDWAEVPYASSDPYDTVYQGARTSEADGFRGDGRFGIEPDKVGDLGLGYLRFYEITLQGKYLEAALDCADELAEHVRDYGNTASAGEKSPWPFRANAINGAAISEYSSNVVGPVMLFDEILRIQQRINLDTARTHHYAKARDIAWKWLYCTHGPVKTFVWNGYFEDSGNDLNRNNRVQITPIELAKYLIRNPAFDAGSTQTVLALINWVATAFRTDGSDAIREQFWCYSPMGSHTARYGSACALWYEKTGETYYRDQAFRFLNFATYMTHENGVVATGPTMPETWFSDGYTDYVRHFIDAMAAVPEWAPADRDHVLRSTSPIQAIRYNSGRISFRTFDDQSDVVIRMVRKPRTVRVGNKTLMESKSPVKEGFVWNPLSIGGVMRLTYASGNEVNIFY